MIISWRQLQIGHDARQVFHIGIFTIYATQTA